MNKHELIMMMLSWLHVLVWIFVMFGGILNRKITVMNMLIALPIIYVIQAMPMHPINTAKSLQVQSHGDATFNKSLLHPREACDRRHHARMLGMTLYEYERNKQQVDHYANSIAITAWVFYIRQKLNDWSFANPLSAQGLIILSYIINSHILYWQS
jgi:hypothetical protein